MKSTNVFMVLTAILIGTVWVLAARESAFLRR